MLLTKSGIFETKGVPLLSLMENVCVMEEFTLPLRKKVLGEKGAKVVMKLGE